MSSKFLAYSRQRRKKIKLIYFSFLLPRFFQRVFSGFLTIWLVSSTEIVNPSFLSEGFEIHFLKFRLLDHFHITLVSFLEEKIAKRFKIYFIIINKIFYKVDFPYPEISELNSNCNKLFQLFSKVENAKMRQRWKLFMLFESLLFKCSITFEKHICSWWIKSFQKFERIFLFNNFISRLFKLYLWRYFVQDGLNCIIQSTFWIVYKKIEVAFFKILLKLSYALALFTLLFENVVKRIKF